MSKIYFFCSLVFLISCNGGSTTQSLPVLDLMNKGVPIKINAPADAKVVVEDMGLMKDVTVMGEGNFSLQILSGMATVTDIAKLKSVQLEEAKRGPFFDSIVEESPEGFIFKKTISEERINYDFRIVKIQADQEYLFQTGLMGKYTLEEVKRMYAAVKM